MKVLIVENDEVVTRIWSRWFSVHHEVRIALCVADALKLIREEMPEIVLLDLRLNGPTHSGLTVYEHIRNELGKDIPIIFITGLEYNVDLFKKAEHRVNSDMERGLSTKMVQKPISIKELDKLINAAA